MSLLITLVILIFSAIIHEISHGLMAEKLGDDTAREQGRITLNPIPHIDPMGSILVPVLVWIATGGRFMFGSAKPVPVNFNNLRSPRSGMALVSLAGPLSNFGLAILFILPIKLGLANSISYSILLQACLINLVLGTFNLIPIPPLDGSKILASLGSERFMYRLFSLERYGFILILLLLYTGILSLILVPVVSIFSSIFGVSFF